MVINKLKHKFNKKEKRLLFYKDTSLMLAMFFLPFGYDALFKLLMEVTGSYWVADIIFYFISGCFCERSIPGTRTICSASKKIDGLGALSRR